MYFISVMVGIGLIGTWTALWQSIATNTPSAEIPNSLATYAIALVAAAFAEVILDDGTPEDEERPSRSNSAFRMFALVMLIASIALGAIALILASQNSLRWSTWIALLATFLSLVLWWIVNAYNPHLSAPDVMANTPLGGPIEPSAELNGNLEGINA